MEIPEKPFRLLDLPPELWSRIVRLVVVNESPICMNKCPLAHRFRDVPYNYERPGITQVCRAISAETLGHYYRSNVFYFGPSVYLTPHRICKQVKLWLEVIGSSNARSIGRLYLTFALEGPKALRPETEAAQDAMEVIGLKHKIVAIDARGKYEKIRELLTGGDNKLVFVVNTSS